MRLWNSTCTDIVSLYKVVLGRGFWAEVGVYFWTMDDYGWLICVFLPFNWVVCRQLQSFLRLIIQQTFTDIQLITMSPACTWMRLHSLNDSDHHGTVYLPGIGALIKAVITHNCRICTFPRIQCQERSSFSMKFTLNSIQYWPVPIVASPD